MTYRNTAKASWVIDVCAFDKESANVCMALFSQTDFLEHVYGYIL